MLWPASNTDCKKAVIHYIFSVKGKGIKSSATSSIALRAIFSRHGRVSVEWRSEFALSGFSWICRCRVNRDVPHVFCWFGAPLSVQGRSHFALKDKQPYRPESATLHDKEQYFFRTRMTEVRSPGMNSRILGMQQVARNTLCLRGCF